MKCSLCGFDFNEENVKSSCSACPLSKGCGLIRCPNCGFEMAPEAKWIKKVLGKTRRMKNDIDR